MLQIKIFPVNPLGANCHVCWEDAGQACIVVDPGFYRPDEEDMVFTFLRDNHLTPDAVFLTHAHFDHAWSAAAVAGRFAARSSCRRRTTLSSGGTPRCWSGFNS